jgi:ABC-type glycerol-3-phosphate transport system substrate-binding protein
MRTSKIVILILALASLAALIPPRALDLGEQTLTMAVWGMPFEDALFHDIYAEGFEKLNPGWQVRYQRHADLIDKYNAWHVQERGADVMRMGIDYYDSFVDKGMLYPLRSFIEDPEVGLTPEEIRDYFPEIWEVLLYERGEIYALPSDNAQYGLYYNRAIFDAYNAAHPESPLEYPHADWTWHDLAHAAEVLTVRNERGETERYGIMFDLWSWPFMAFHAQAGGELWDEAGTTTRINSPAGARALEFLVSIIPEDAPIKAIDLAESAAGPAQLFKVGKLAMLLDGSWRAPNIELDYPDLDFAIAPLPHGEERAVVSGSVLWAVSAHSDNPRKAWEMIKWMTNREQSLRYWDALRVAPPSRLSVVRSEEFRETSGIVTPGGRVRVPGMPRELFDERAAWLMYAMTPHAETGEYPGFVATSLYQYDLQSAIAGALVAAVKEGMPAQEALDRAAAQVHEIIDRDRRAKGLEPVERDPR